MNCYACGIVLTHVSGSPARDDNFQFDNAMLVAFSGGYGMFTDLTFQQQRNGIPREVTGHCDTEEVFICHECMHDLCERAPWVGKLLDPYHSHSHRREWKEAHPEHWGWDYDED